MNSLIALWGIVSVAHSTSLLLLETDTERFTLSSTYPRPAELQNTVVYPASSRLVHKLRLDELDPAYAALPPLERTSPLHGMPLKSSSLTSTTAHIGLPYDTSLYPSLPSAQMHPSDAFEKSPVHPHLSKPSPTELRMMAAHYLWDARRSLDLHMEGVQSLAECCRSTIPMAARLRNIKKASNRLFVLLPLSRLSDYLATSETTSAKLDEAADVAAQLLSMVEDLYLLCAGEKALEGDRGPVVSLGRLHKLKSIFAEPSEEDRGHISFLEACLANPSTALVPSATYVALEDALRALLRIKPMESKLREGFLSTPKPAPDNGEDRELLFKIPPLLTSPVQSSRASVDPAAPVSGLSKAALSHSSGGGLPVPITAVGSLQSSVMLPLFEMLTAPFIMLSGVGTSDVVLDAANIAAQSLLKGHTNGALSGFRFFLPSDKVQTSGGAQSLQAAQWFQEVAAGLKRYAAATPHVPGGAVEASVEWLRGPGGLHEVSLKHPVKEGQETLLAALQQGTAASSTGVPLVVVDVPSGTIFGADGHTWLDEGAHSPVFSGTKSKHNVAVVMGYSLFETFLCDLVEVNRTLSFSKEGGWWHPLFVEPHLEQRESDRTGFASSKTSQGRLQRGESNAKFSVSLAYQAFSRGNDVDEVRLPSMLQRLESRSQVAEVFVSPEVPPNFIVNDNLLVYVIREVLQYNRLSGVSPSTVLINRCGMHVVADFVPQQMVPHDPDGHSAYAPLVRQFYAGQESDMGASHLFADVGNDLENSAPAATCEWIDKVLALSGLPLPPRDDDESHKDGYNNPFTATRNISDSDYDHVLGVMGREQTGVHSLPSKIMWAVQVGASEDVSQHIVAPTQYLSAAICGLLVSIKAAVVVSSSGAATLAFPYITEGRVTLLKDMDRVHQPLSAAADLGIAELNRMADEAALEHRCQLREEEKRGDVVSLGYDTALGRLNEALLKRSITIPSLGVLHSHIHKRKGLHETEDRIKPTPPAKAPGQTPFPLQMSRSLRDEGPVEASFPNPAFPIVLKPSHRYRMSTEGTGAELLSSDQARRPSMCSLMIDDMDGVSSSSHRGGFSAAPELSGAHHDKTVYTSMLGDPSSTRSFADLNLPEENPYRVDFAKIRFLFLCAVQSAAFFDWLVSIGHSVTIVSTAPQIAGFLKCGIEAYDVVVIQWSNTLVTPEIQYLLGEAQKLSKSVPVFFAVLDPNARASRTLISITPIDIDTSSITGIPFPIDRLPLPDYANAPFIIHGLDINDACMRNRALMRSHVRLGRILKDLKGDDALKYQQKNKLGSGSFGDVYEVTLYASKGRLAMKRIPLGVISIDRMEQLYKEAAIMRELDHRNIVQLSHITCNDTHLHIFMELCDYTLKDVLDEGFGHFVVVTDMASSFTHLTLSFAKDAHRPVVRQKSSAHSFSAIGSNLFIQKQSTLGSASPTTRLSPSLIVHDIFTAVNYLHSHDIVHRDIKPHNILFLNGVAKLADFGTATTLSIRQNSLSTMKGTVPYMAPEVFLGEPYRKSCDVWSLGILIGEILGLRFAPTALLHFPALQSFYKSLDEDESMPVVVTNFKKKGLKQHFSTQLLTALNDALQEARAMAKEERRAADQCKLLSLSINTTVAGSGRTAFLIEVDPKAAKCVTTRHRLPASLVELLESMFNRNPDKRPTAEQLLQHPIANEKDWLPTMTIEVTELKNRFNDGWASGNDLHSQRAMNFSFVDEDAGSQDDTL